ncbi:MAG: pyrroline-5-carboxylate reductase [Chloroflexota bacterium]|nr:pyrroline-5-carboxylate reductase [Chloroflexota bacterium]MDE2894169.1 pyrroline-5-carboxylate reductase [Chloroflexota bacterium]
MTRIAVVGGGTMGATFIRAVTNAALVDMSDLVVCEVVHERREWLQREFDGIAVTEHLAGALATSDAIYLSVKPQDLDSLPSDSRVGSRLLISILAGSTIAEVEASTGAERVVRAMPNTPAQIGKGFTAWTATDSVTAEERELVSRLLDAMGEQLYVPDESTIDKITAVSGSGPAYVFLIIEAMINAAVNIGLRPDDARRMVLQTVIGSSEFAQHSGEHLATLKDMVTSPGGTTAAGLQVLEQRAVRSALIDAVAAAHRRAVELGQR